MVYGEYQNQEVKNLGRFISVMKFRPLVWQTSHPYILADRWVLTTATCCRNMKTNIFNTAVSLDCSFLNAQPKVVFVPVTQTWWIHMIALRWSRTFSFTRCWRIIQSNVNDKLSAEVIWWDTFHILSENRGYKSKGFSVFYSTDTHTPSLPHKLIWNTDC